MGFLFAPPAAENPAPTISYASPQTYPEDVAISTLSPTTANATSFADITGLPTGLSLNTSNGDITGTPTVVASAANYTIRATGPGGTADAVINIAIVAVVAGAVVTIMGSTPTRMAPYAIHAHAGGSTLPGAKFHTARFQWTITGPVGWVSPTCTDPRPVGTSMNADGDTISLDSASEGFSIAVPADVDGTYNVKVTITDEDGTTYQDDSDVVVSADSRTAIYVSGTGNDTTGTGLIGAPYRHPKRAWTDVVSNGKADQKILLERGYAYSGLGNNTGGDTGATNLWITAYGSGNDPVMQWSTADYSTGTTPLVSGSGYENVFIDNIKMTGNDADSLSGAVCVSISNQTKNFALQDVSFGQSASLDMPGNCMITNSDDGRESTITEQQVGIAMWNCGGWSDAYGLFNDVPGTKGTIDTGTPPTTTVFYTTNGALSTADDFYNNMEGAFLNLANSDHDNEVVTITDYEANVGGLAKFTVSPALSSTPVATDVFNIRDRFLAGDTDVFFFGCTFTGGDSSTEVRLRAQNVRRWCAVGTKADGGTTSAQPKAGFRLMVSTLGYLYRCSAPNGGAQMGVDLATNGFPPYEYTVFDRSYFECLDVSGKLPITVVGNNQSIIKSCVIKGDFVAGDSGSLFTTGGNSDKNTGQSDFRLVHNTMMTKRQRDVCEFHISPAWAANAFTIENNLISRDAWVGYHDFLWHKSQGHVIFGSVVGNVYCPDQGSQHPITSNGAEFRLGSSPDWNGESYVSGDAYGAEDVDDLVTNDWVPVDTTAKTNRTTTSKGVHQDYYGRDPTGQAYVGAVSQAVV